MLAGQDGSTDGHPASEALAARFRTLCDAELEKITKFYKDKEEELLETLNDLKEEVAQVEEEGAFGDLEDESDEDSGESGDEEGQGLIKRGTKLFKKAVDGITPSSGSGARSGSKSRNDEENRPGAMRRRSSSFSRTQPSPRKRRNTGSEDSNASSTEALARVPSNNPEGLPEDEIEDINQQLDRTMQAAAGGANQQKVNAVPPPGLGRRKSRALSFGAASSSNDIWSSNSRLAMDMKITFKLRLQALFRDLSQLKEYVTLNQSALRHDPFSTR